MLGFINLFKPAGPTSTQFGARLRRIYHIPGGGKLAVGHLGTLDPQAAGVLPIALGKATRLLPLIEDRRKAYACTLVFGRSTSTGDAAGETVALEPVPTDVADRLTVAMRAFTGPIEQTPPMFSAVHHGGVRLYELARAGRSVAREKRRVIVYGLTLLGFANGVARLRVACSEGTYIRTLCEDLARACGTVGHMGALLREASGPFVLYESRTLEQIAAAPAAALVPPERVIPIPTVVLDPQHATDFRAGRAVPLANAPGEKHVFVRDASRSLVGVGETLGTLLAPRRVFGVKIHHALPAADDAAYAAALHAHPLVVAVGFFDGFHLGHRSIVRELVALRRPGERAGVVTFRNHPATYLRPGNEPPLIMTLEERINSFARAGIDEAFVLPFDAAIASLPPALFLDQTLAGRIGARAMVVGENFRFGAKRAGDIAFAQSHLQAQGRIFVAVPNMLEDGERISSTRIRTAISAGDLACADRLLGASYTLRGHVTLGFGRGHDLGFPTANVVTPPEKMLPPDGVYAVVGRHDGRDYRGLVSIGTNPTFAGRSRTVEAWLLDFFGSLYGEELALREFRFLRPQQRFADVDALLAQMRADAAAVGFPTFS